MGSDLYHRRAVAACKAPTSGSCPSCSGTATYGAFTPCDRVTAGCVCQGKPLMMIDSEQKISVTATVITFTVERPRHSPRWPRGLEVSDTWKVFLSMSVLVLIRKEPGYMLRWLFYKYLLQLDSFAQCIFFLSYDKSDLKIAGRKNIALFLFVFCFVFWPGFDFHSFWRSSSKWRLDRSLTVPLLRNPSQQVERCPNLLDLFHISI